MIRPPREPAAQVDDAPRWRVAGSTPGPMFETAASDLSADVTESDDASEESLPVFWHV